jgi:ABC-2 type transport system permease protein
VILGARGCCSRCRWRQLALLLAMIGVFIVANLAVGFTFSTLARNQLQAMQMTFFFFLPSCCCRASCSRSAACRSGRSGSGSILPLTHFLRIVRGIMLKGSDAGSAGGLWPMLAFTVLAAAVALLRYRQTVD